MLSKWIILFFLGSVTFGQDVIGEGFYEDELIDFLQENYKTSTTLGYTNARDVMYLEIDRKDNGQGITNFIEGFISPCRIYIILAGA